MKISLFILLLWGYSTMNAQTVQKVKSNAFDNDSTPVIFNPTPSKPIPSAVSNANQISPKTLYIIDTLKTPAIVPKSKITIEN